MANEAGHYQSAGNVREMMLLGEDGNAIEAPKGRATVGVRNTKNKKVRYEVEIYKAFAGCDFENDSENEEDKQPLNPNFEPSPEYKEQTGVIARNTVAGVNSFAQTYFFLVKGFLGSGMLTLPLGFCNGGATFCVGCLIVVCAISIMGMNTVLTTRQNIGGSFSDLAKAALGSTGKAIIDISIALCQVGHGTVYIIFITQNFKAITAIWGWECPLWISGIIIFLNFVAIGCFVIILPLVLVRDVSSLGSLMILATVCTFWTIFAVIGFSGIQISQEGIYSKIDLFVKPDTCLIFLGMSSFLYGKIGLIIPIRDIMKEKQHFRSCLSLSLWTICGIFSIFGLIPYLAYGANEKVKNGGGMITLALDQRNPVVQGTELVFVLALIPSFALMIYVPVKIWEKALYGDWARSWKRTWLKNLWRTLAVAGIAYLAVATGKTFDKVMAIFGSLFGGPLTFIWPAVFHLILMAKDATDRIKDYFLICFGVLSSSFTLYLTILKLMKA